MMQEPTKRKPDRKARAAARQIISAMDRIIEAAKQAEQAREVLAGNTKP
jgi:hypothetical protein